MRLVDDGISSRQAVGRDATNAVYPTFYCSGKRSPAPAQLRRKRVLHGRGEPPKVVHTIDVGSHKLNRHRLQAEHAVATASQTRQPATAPPAAPAARLRLRLPLD
jgi:hypothetical protein